MPNGVLLSITQVLCDYYFGSEDAMIRLDMSEYMERHTVSKLIGAPPGACTARQLALPPLYFS